MKTRRQPYNRRRKQTRKQKGGHELSKPQHKHLKKTLVAMGAIYHHIADIFEIHNRTARSPSMRLVYPEQILEYALHKSANPEFTQWSVADNQYVKYSEARFRRSATQHQLLTHMQSDHLKRTLTTMGPFFFPVEEVFARHNQTVTRPEEFLSSPQEILDYVQYKAENPAYFNWAVYANTVRYITPQPNSQYGGVQVTEMSEILTHARRLQQAAQSMDEFHLFAIGGSTAVAIFMHELLTADVDRLSDIQKREGSNLFESLKSPDDLDFKYQKQGRIFDDAIQRSAQSVVHSQPFTLAPVPSRPTFSKPGLGLSLSMPTLSPTPPPTSLSLTTSAKKDCDTWIDIAEFRCCDPPAGSPIFYPNPTTSSPFSKIEFNPPSDFKFKPMLTVKIHGLTLLGARALLYLYEKYTRQENTYKVSALKWLVSCLKEMPDLATKYGAV